MTITPFLALRLRGKKDVVLARRRARRVASLLQFDVHEQTCIAAGTFVVACQALILFRKASLAFQIENHQLHIFAQENEPMEPNVSTGAKRLAGLFPEADSKSLLRLIKPLPAQLDLPAEEVELGWLVEKVEEISCNGLFDEIVKQNQEVLALLHELRLFQDKGTQLEEKTSNQSAA